MLFVATENDSVYAFDAEGASGGAPLWHTSFLKAAAGLAPVPSRDVMCPFIEPGVGITPTPAIDTQTGTIYVLARTSEDGGILRSARFSQHLHALSIATGQEKPGSPVEITAPGFDPLRELPRAGLLLLNGQVILTWASSCDVSPFHGWAMAYHAHTLKQKAVFNTSPAAGQSGIWQSDNAPAADAQGNTYAATGNGEFTVNTGGRDYGDSLLRLSLNGGSFTVTDYFTPSDHAAISARDLDLGSGGPIVLPDQPGAHPHLILIGGKTGVLYVLDRDRLGHLQTAANNPVLQAVHFGGGIYAAPAYWNGHVYILASDDELSDFVLDHGNFPATAAIKGSHRFGNPGATPAVSANGNRNGIVWLIETKAWNDFDDKTAILHAYEAGNVEHELYNSEMNSARDRAGAAMRFTIPTVANGRVYVDAKGEVDVYGLLPRPAR